MPSAHSSGRQQALSPRVAAALERLSLGSSGRKTSKLVCEPRNSRIGFHAISGPDSRSGREPKESRAAEFHQSAIRNLHELRLLRAPPRRRHSGIAISFSVSTRAFAAGSSPQARLARMDRFPAARRSIEGPFPRAASGPLPGQKIERKLAGAYEIRFPSCIRRAGAGVQTQRDIHGSEARVICFRA